MEIVNVINIDEIPPFLTGSINDGAVALKHANDKGTHDWRNDSPPILRGSVNIEVAEDGYVHRIKFAVTFAKGCSAVLTVSADSNRADLLFACGKLIDAFVLGGRVCVNEFTHVRPSRGLQTVQCSQHVHACGFQWVVHTLGQTRLRCKMEDCVGSLK